MKPTLRSNYVASACQTHDCADPYDQHYDRDPCLVDDSHSHLEQGHQPVRVGYASHYHESARMVLPTTEELGVKRRESLHGFSFSRLAEKTHPIIEEVKDDPD